MTKGANGGILLKRIRMAAVLLTLCLLLPGAGLFASAQNGQITVGVYDYKSESFLVKEQREARCQFSDVLSLEAGGITTVYANDGGIVVAY